MRIFCAIRHSKDSRFFYGALWSGNFYPALSKLGHEIIESQTDLLPTSRFMHVAADFTREELELRTRTTERIMEEVRIAHRQKAVDLFLSYFYNSHFDPTGFDELRRLGIPSVNFYCNSIYQFGLVSAIAAKADYSWHAEREAHQSYLSVGAKPVWVQMGADPNVYHPVDGIRRQAAACFIGQRYADRDRLAAALINGGVPLDLYGSGWRECDTATSGTPDEESPVYLGRVHHQAGSFHSYADTALAVVRTEGLSRGATRLVKQWRYRSTTQRLSPLIRSAAKGRAADVAETFARYEVVVNFSNVWADGRPGSQLIPHVRLRDFEAPMCRTCYVTGHTDELQEFYELGKEIEVYLTPEEMVEKTKFYLAHPVAAEKLREAGYQRARRDHTWSRRFQQLFLSIGL
jgi:spore maturation protein CgeB